MNGFDFLAHYWWLAFPLFGMASSLVWGRGGKRRRHLERRDADRTLADPYERGALSASSGAPDIDVSRVRQDMVQRVIEMHKTIDKRWLEYEMDAGKLIDFPLMTDMREERTVAFHRAKRRADALRPADAADIHTKAELDDYRSAVHEYETAFDVAEAEALRIRDSQFGAAERESLDRARKLLGVAIDQAATPAERQTAYTRAKKELEGLIVLPRETTQFLDQRAAGVIERPTPGLEA